MDENQQIDHVITAFYDAAANPQQWSAALAGLTELVGAFASTMVLWDLHAGAPSFSALTDRYSPAAVDLYARRYGALDVPAQTAARAPVGQLVLCTDFVSADFARRSEFYNDFLIPNGGRYMAGSKLIHEDGLIGLIGIHRGVDQGPFEKRHEDVFARALPHLVQATRLLQRFLALEAERSAYSSVLDHLPWGVIVVTADAKVTALNAAAEAIIAQDDGLHARHGHLRTSNVAETAALHKLIAATVRTAAGKGGNAGNSLGITRPSGKGKLALQVAPLPEAGAMRLGGSQPSAALFITLPEAQRSAPAELLRQFFGLTPAETRLATSLAIGKSLKEIAADRALSKNTVRAQMQSVFAKTDTKRQAELVRLVLGLPSVRGL